MDLLCNQINELNQQQTDSSIKVIENLDNFINDIEAIQNELKNEQTNDIDIQTKLSKLNLSLKKKNYPKKTTRDRKEFRSSLTKFGKTLDKKSTYIPCNNWDYDSNLINFAIAQHFCHAGKFDLCKIFAKECNLDQNQFTLEPYSEMHIILSKIQENDISLVLKWTQDNLEFLTKKGSSLEFRIRKIQYLEILSTGKNMDAVNFSRTYFGKFAPSFMNEIQQLTMLLLNPGEIELINDYQVVGKLFVEDFCALHKIPKHSLLYTTTMAGSMSQPGLQKMAKLKNISNWSELETLPAEIELPFEFRFHSEFICPISREHTTETNPPMLLKCGHAISKEALKDLSKRETTRFKCPYCPTEQTASDCVTIYF